MRHAQQDCPAHRMRQAEPWRWQAFLPHPFDDRVDITVVKREIVDMPFIGVLQVALRQALAAPVEGNDAKSAPQQFAGRLEILLDVLAAALANDDGAPGLSGAAAARPPMGGAQCTVIRSDQGGHRCLWRQGIVGRRHQAHEIPAAMSAKSVQPL